MKKQIWKDVKGYEGIYKVSNTGLIKNIKRNKILATRTTYDKYLRINLNKNGNKKTFKIHRLVADAFIPNPHNKPTVNHIDGNKQNNMLDNLEWMTFKDNYQYYLNNKGRLVGNQSIRK
jgi:hypothetical protein